MRNILSISGRLLALSIILTGSSIIPPWTTMAWAQLGAPTPVEPFLDGKLPKRTPQPGSSSSSDGSGWEVVDAFPKLVVPNTLVIESNPGDNRLYVGSREGVVVSFENNENAMSSEVFMDLRDRVAEVWDAGFFGLAFHPDFGKAGSPNRTTFYAYYSSYCPTSSNGQRYLVDFSNCNPGYPKTQAKGFFNTWLRLSRFQAYQQGAVWRGAEASEVPLFNIRLYNIGHRGGGPVFGNDGRLYVAIGDQGRKETAQDIVKTFEGGVMRLEVDVTDDRDGSWTCPEGSFKPTRQMQSITRNPDELSGQSYCIPDDNPWPGRDGQNFGEYYTLGHRSPHRITVDRPTGRIWVGEVGANAREEINLILKGRNYQWPFREGKIDGIKAKPANVIGTEQPPLIDFDRDEARSLIGGYVCRGNLCGELLGKYIAGDYRTDKIWAITLDTGNMTATKELLTTFPSGSLSTFGQDNDGNIYMGDVFAEIPLQRLNRIGASVADAPALLSQTGALSDTVDFVVNPAAVPFDPVPFWSDGAHKQRWLFLPNNGSHNTVDEQIAFSENGNWGFPEGTVAMKHFELALDESEPGARIRLETRLLVKGEDGKVYGLTYRWREDQSEADLLTTAETETYTIIKKDGDERQQKWLFPARSDCLQCHTNAAGGFLALRTHQLNRPMTYPSTGQTGNQLKAWNARGMFQPALADWEIDTFLKGAALDELNASVELRARSWLDSNCSYCHRPETGNRAAFDARLTTPLTNQGMIWGAVNNDLGIDDPYIIHPGDPLSSVLYHRVEAVGNSPFKMPPLAKELPHEEALDVLWDWIHGLNSNDFGHAGVWYEYYELTDPAALPVFDALTPVSTGSAATFDISPRNRDNDFAFRFIGFIEIPTAGNWTFYTDSDDGSQLLINGQLVVDNDGLHAQREQAGDIRLTAGFHPIEVAFFEAGGQQILNVSYSGPGVAKQLIPAKVLYQQDPVMANQSTE